MENDQHNYCNCHVFNVSSLMIYRKVMCHIPAQLFATSSVSSSKLQDLQAWLWDDTYRSILSSGEGRTAPDDRTAKHLLLPTKRSPRKAIGSSPGSCPPEMIGSSSQQGRKHARAQTWNVWIFGIWSSHALTQASYLEMSPLYCKCC